MCYTAIVSLNNPTVSHIFNRNKIKYIVKVICMSSLIQMLMDSSLVTSMYSTLYFFNKYSGAAGLYMRRVLKALGFGDDCFYTQ